MPQEQLPIYQIQDFIEPTRSEDYFYFKTLAIHLQEHAFIQRPHKHDFYILIFISQGSGTHTIDFIEYQVKSNMAFCMIPGQVHSWQLSEDVDGYVIFFTTDFYLKEFPQRQLYYYPFFNALLHTPVLDFKEEDKVVLLNLVNLLQQEFLRPQKMRHEMLSRYLDILLIQLTRLYQVQSTKTEGHGVELSQLQKLENLIDDHYKEHQPVSYYAYQLHVTAKQLNDTCKRALGTTTNELIQRRIILEAQRLLVHSDLTSSQIAAELGYFDVTYFFRFFKKHVGYTPEQFRNLNK